MSNNIEADGSSIVEGGMNQAYVPTIIAGLTLVIPAVVGLLHSKVPTVLYPFPALVVLPAFAFSLLQLWVAAALVPPLFFFAWNPGLLKGKSKVPKRSGWLLLVGTGLTAVWFAAGWRDGMHYQGSTYVYSVFFGNVVCILSLGAAFVRCKRGESFAANLAFHWALFLWLAWYALPYLGELP